MARPTQEGQITPAASVDRNRSRTRGANPSTEYTNNHMET